MGLDISTRLSEQLADAFGGRVIALLYYGSGAFHKATDRKTDHDFTFVLDKRSHGDLTRLAGIVSRHSNLDFTVHFLAELEAIGWDDFREGSQGAFFLKYLATAHTLLGVNIFVQHANQLDPDIEWITLKHKVQEYFWRLDQWTFRNDRAEAGSIVPAYRKYVVRTAQDLLIMEGAFTFSDVNALSDDEFVKSVATVATEFSPFTRALFRSRWAEAYDLSILVKFREALQQDFLRIVSKRRLGAETDRLT